MSRKTSFKELLFRELNSKNCFGQSKYEAKQKSIQNGNKGKVNGIYSKKTMADYKKIAEQFANWQKEKGYYFKSLADVKEKDIISYLTERKQENKSAWTLSKDLSALNKIFHTSITKEQAGLPQRRNSDIKNNRGFGNNYRTSTYKRNQDIINFISSCGVRRQSLTTITPSNAIRNKDNIIIGFSVVEKGGKSRNCYVLNGKQEEITKFVNTHIEVNGNKPFWNKVDKNLNTHWYRGEYAKTLYNDLIFAKNKKTDYFNGYYDTFINQNKLNSATKNYGAVSKGYDTEILGIVSQNLGHNRIDVVINHYLNKF